MTGRLLAKFFLLTCILLQVSACEKAKKGAAPTATSSALYQNHLSCVPLEPGTNAKLVTFWNDSDTLTTEDFTSMPMEEVNKKGLCVIKEELFDQRTDVPKMFFMFGNDDGLKQVRDLVFELAQKLGTTGALVNRAVCILEGNRAHLDELSRRNDVEFMAWVGHGVDGDLIEFGNDQKISPSSLSEFQSKILKRATFVSCQIGKKQTSWESLFSKSTKIDSSNENVPVATGLSALYEMAESEIATCKFLNGHN